jgi:phosphohistidine phosphatase
MVLYLIRHAEAIPAVDAGIGDPDRYLTPTGRKGARRVAKKLRKMGVTFDGILTSPYVRSVQTAEVTAAGTRYSGVVESLPALALGVWDPAKLAESFKSRDLSGSYALVGHNPDLEEMAAELLGLDGGEVSFSKGMVCCLETKDASFGGKSARLQWVLRPKKLKVLKSF